MKTNTAKPKKHTSELQPEGSKKPIAKNPKVKSSNTTNVTKSKDKVQTDKSLKLNHKLKKKEDAALAKAAKKEVQTSKEEVSGSITASPSSASDDNQNTKKELLTNKSLSGDGESASECKSQKWYAPNMDMEDFAASQPTFPRPIKNCHLRKGKDEDEDFYAQPSTKRKKESVHNPAIWKIISGGTTDSLQSLDSTTATTMTVTDKAIQDKTKTTSTVEVPSPEVNFVYPSLD
ncbi:hypothetical protein BGZ95_008239 [Linnemannia exigua]|uniref:Uncharacterized protein n=1 Tax=Linnemannia exigua TaxID=604196 RepID=A0AAD4DEQ1_9FUNG|nr:hypothetical protein BGZ95_008239 [Linnemannia exigua]